MDVLDTASGVLLRTVPVGIAPSRIALDASAGKVYVLNGGFGDRVPPSISVLSAQDGTPLAVAGIRSLQPTQQLSLYTLSGHLYLIGPTADGSPGQPSTAIETRDGESGALLARRIVPGIARSVSVDVARGRLWLALDLAPRGSTVFDANGGTVLRSPPNTVSDLLATDPASGHLYLPTPYGQPPGIEETAPSGSSIRTITLPVAVAVTPNRDAPQLVALAADGPSRRLFAITSPPIADSGAPLPATLWLIDIDAGRVLGSRPLGVAPTGIAVDAGAGTPSSPMPVVRCKSSTLAAARPLALRSRSRASGRWAAQARNLVWRPWRSIPPTGMSSWSTPLLTA